MRRRLVTLALAGVATLLGTTAAPAGWKSVIVVLEERDGSTREVRGSRIAYGHHIREFTPKGTRDRLRVERSLVFPDRDVQFPDLDRIEFELADDDTLQMRVPTVMRITFHPNRKSEVVTLVRNVSELRGFGQPKPVQLIVTTADGDVHLDITPPYDDEARVGYRPIRSVRFE